jgi:hypothetical protein
LLFSGQPPGGVVLGCGAVQFGIPTQKFTRPITE